MRIFCALRLPEPVLDAIVHWQAKHLHSGRVVPREALHVTLAFLGSIRGESVPAVGAELRAAAEDAGLVRLALRARRLRTTRSVAMLVLDDLGGSAGALAADLFGRLEALGLYERERRPWLPHVTVLRFRERPRLDPPPLAVGEFSPSDAAVYHSVLRRGGAQYQVVESVFLGG